MIIVNVIGKSIHILFDRIILNGEIQATSMDESKKTILKSSINNTNTVVLKVPDYKGKLKLEIRNEEKTILKHLTIT